MSYNNLMNRICDLMLIHTDHALPKQRGVVILKKLVKIASMTDMQRHADNIHIMRMLNNINYELSGLEYVD